MFRPNLGLFVIPRQISVHGHLLDFGLGWNVQLLLADVRVHGDGFLLEVVVIGLDCAGKRG